MKKKDLTFLKKLGKNTCGIFFLGVIVNSIIIAFLYRYYDNRAKVEKSQILQNYYEKILELSLFKLNSLAQRLYTNLQDSNISINVCTLQDLEMCINTIKCVKYNLFRFNVLIDRYIPKSIYYKIELNKKFLYSNSKSINYVINQTYQINNSNELTISLGMEDIFWAETEVKIKKTFWIVSLFITANFIWLYIFLNLSLRRINNKYESYYKDNYAAMFDQIKLNFDQELKDYKTNLIKKIWSINFNKQKDLEINYLLAQEANKIAFENEGLNKQKNTIKDYRAEDCINEAPCSIVLYQKTKLEEINVINLIELFTNRFDQEDENISLVISSKEKIIHFATQAALYQIIYSVISYLIFLLKKQSSTSKFNINLFINNVEQMLELRFEYDGFLKNKEKDLLSMSNHFFKTHANPFLLNLGQVFNTLRGNGFDCSIYYNQHNIIEILEQPKIEIQPGTQRLNNIVSLTSFIEKNE